MQTPPTSVLNFTSTVTAQSNVGADKAAVQIPGTPFNQLLAARQLSLLGAQPQAFAEIQAQALSRFSRDQGQELSTESVLREIGLGDGELLPIEGQVLPLPFEGASKSGALPALIQNVGDNSDLQKSPVFGASIGVASGLRAPGGIAAAAASDLSDGLAISDADSPLSASNPQKSSPDNFSTKPAGEVNVSAAKHRYEMARLTATEPLERKPGSARNESTPTELSGSSPIQAQAKIATSELTDAPDNIQKVEDPIGGKLSGRDLSAAELKIANYDPESHQKTAFGSAALAEKPSPVAVKNIELANSEESPSQTRLMERSVTSEAASRASNFNAQVTEPAKTSSSGESGPSVPGGRAAVAQTQLSEPSERIAASLVNRDFLVQEADATVTHIERSSMSLRAVGNEIKSQTVDPAPSGLVGGGREAEKLPDRPATGFAQFDEKFSLSSSPLRDRTVNEAPQIVLAANEVKPRPLSQNLDPSRLDIEDASLEADGLGLFRDLPANATPAARAVASLSIPLHAVDNPAWAQAFTARIGWMVGNGVKEARINLHPEELGSIQVQLSMDGDGTRVKFQAENSDTRELIERMLPRLVQGFEQQGMRLDDARVSTMNAQNSFANSAQNQAFDGSTAHGGGGQSDKQGQHRAEDDIGNQPLSHESRRDNPDGIDDYA